MSLQEVIDLVKLVPEEELDVIFRVLEKFVPDDVLLPEEELALAEAEKDIKNGDIYTHEEAWA